MSGITVSITGLEELVERVVQPVSRAVRSRLDALRAEGVQTSRAGVPRAHLSVVFHREGDRRIGDDPFMQIESFSAEVSGKLGWYVYRLIDPRNGETFYVGKGRGNRVFSHIHSAEGLEGDDLDNKIKRIRQIQLAGFEVAHVIHRHGMDERTAFEVEAALIDAYPGLTNIVGGTGSNDYGAMHAKEIIARYAAEPADFQDKALLISVNRSAAERSLYEATRYAWKVNPAKARKADVVLATLQGLIVGAFIPTDWLPATAEHFPDREEVPGRWGFIGQEASDELRQRYVGKRVPDAYRKPGASNPIKYTY